MPSEFRLRVRDALNKDQARANIRRAMDGLMVKYDQAFPDKPALAELRQRGMTIRAHALSRLPELLEQLEANCRNNGIQVHWAEDTTDANGIVLDIMHRHAASKHF